MSLSGFSLSRNSNCATTTLAVWSFTGPTRNTMRSRRQPAVDVVGAFTAARRFNDHGHQAQIVRVQRAHEVSLECELQKLGRIIPPQEQPHLRCWRSGCNIGASRPAWRPRSGRRDRQLAISSSNGNSLSITLACPSTYWVTLFSTTTASTSAMRCRSPRYQRTTSDGFS